VFSWAFNSDFWKFSSFAALLIMTMIQAGQWCSACSLKGRLATIRKYVAADIFCLNPLVQIAVSRYLQDFNNMRRTQWAGTSP